MKSLTNHLNKIGYPIYLLLLILYTLGCSKEPESITPSDPCDYQPGYAFPIIDSPKNHIITPALFLLSRQVPISVRFQPSNECARVEKAKVEVFYQSGKLEKVLFDEYINQKGEFPVDKKFKPTKDGNYKIVATAIKGDGTQKRVKETWFHVQRRYDPNCEGWLNIHQPYDGQKIKRNRPTRIEYQVDIDIYCSHNAKLFLKVYRRRPNNTYGHFRTILDNEENVTNFSGSSPITFRNRGKYMVSAFTVRNGVLNNLTRHYFEVVQ